MEKCVQKHAQKSVQAFENLISSPGKVLTVFGQYLLQNKRLCLFNTRYSSECTTLRNDSLGTLTNNAKKAIQTATTLSLH